jgi:hypothetical protein
MAPAAVTTPKILTNPGYLFIAPLGSTLPTDSVTGGVFTDSWPAAWLPLGATEDGSDFSYGSTVEAATVAELFDPVQYFTTERHGTIAFNLANFGASNYNRAMNGGVTALAATSGTGATSLWQVEPPDPGNEVRAMIGWESLDNTVRLVCRQTIQGGEIATAFKKAPTLGVIPCTFNLEKPTSSKPFRISFADSSRA